MIIIITNHRLRDWGGTTFLQGSVLAQSVGHWWSTHTYKNIILHLFENQTSSNLTKLYPCWLSSRYEPWVCRASAGGETWRWGWRLESLTTFQEWMSPAGWRSWSPCRALPPGTRQNRGGRSSLPRRNRFESIWRCCRQSSSGWTDQTWTVPWVRPAGSSSKD